MSAAGLLEIVTREDADAWARIGPDDITELTEAATAATFYRHDLTEDQVSANRRIVAISASGCSAAAQNEHQKFVAAFVGCRLAGYAIATRHQVDDLELDWLMVHPDYHGSRVAVVLANHAIEWLGADKPLWLNVIRFNERAIRFYRRFGFEIDPLATTAHIVPHWVMRRAARRP